ncbi:MAG: MBL fold metallo-hydrolase [Melioribacter sp.]|nr:MBL fold metallo-hydrolase [Melioribacter sp.]
MKIGKYKLTAIDTVTFALDGGAMFGIIPKPLWQKFNPADDQNRVTLGARSLLLENGKQKILIDTGIGEFWDDKFKSIYRFDRIENTLLDSLKKLNITKDEITDVILTHLHFDHTGGSTTLVNGKWEPSFPNANYYVQKEHYEWAVNPSDRDRASFVQNRFVPILENGLLKLVDKDYKVDDEFDFKIINGHTFAQQMVKISDGSNTLLYCGDLLPFSSHIPLPYIMGYDLQPLVTLQEKKELYPQAIDENWILFFEHDPEVVAATITKNDKGFFIKDVYTELP